MRNSIHRWPPPHPMCEYNRDNGDASQRALSRYWLGHHLDNRPHCAEMKLCWAHGLLWICSHGYSCSRTVEQKWKHQMQTRPHCRLPAGFFFCFLFECAFTCSSTLCSYQGHKATNAAGGSQAAFGRRVTKEQGRGQDKCEGGAGFTDPSEGCCHPGGALQHHWEPQTVPLLVLFYLIFCLFKTK